MSNSQEQSLNEDAVFLPVSETSPEFLHCERERCALENLMSSGPGAFYTWLGQERLAPFLSPEEVNQISGWVEEYHISQLQLENGEEMEDEEGSGVQDFCSRYFPTHSDTPAPSLVLGWPERVWVGRAQATVHTNPPAMGQPSIREVIRRLLQGATKVIAIVTDRLTDSVVIGDLHSLASKGVPVYIILNQRSIKENFNSQRLKHPNIQVRGLGGKTFCSREGKMVVGEMKDNFLLVDLETVVLGNYSLTWSDAHLHRQLVTVLSGQLVESFDHEFRILFAASLPIPDTWSSAKPPMDVTCYSDISVLGEPKPLPPESISSPPPSLPTGSPMNGDTVGVFQKYLHVLNTSFNEHSEPGTTENPLQLSPSDRKTVLWRKIDHAEMPALDGERLCPSPPFVLKRDNGASLKNIIHAEADLPTSTGREIQHRVKPRSRSDYFRRRSTESDKLLSAQPSNSKTEVSSRQEPLALSSHQRWYQPLKREDTLTESSMDRGRPNVWENSPSTSRRPLILRVPQDDSFSSLSDILKRRHPRQSSLAPITRGSKTTVSELSRSMMELSVPNTDTGQQRDHIAPKFQANYFDPFRVTPALALMKKRNDDIKSGMFRQPNPFISASRPRPSSFGLQMDRSMPQTDRDRGREDTQ